MHGHYCMVIGVYAASKLVVVNVYWGILACVVCVYD